MESVLLSVCYVLYTPTDTPLPVRLFACVSPNSLLHYMCVFLYGSCVSFMCVYMCVLCDFLCAFFTCVTFLSHTWTCMDVIGTSPLCDFFSFPYFTNRGGASFYAEINTISCVARHTS